MFAFFPHREERNLDFPADMCARQYRQYTTLVAALALAAVVPEIRGQGKNLTHFVELCLSLLLLFLPANFQQQFLKQSEQGHQIHDSRIYKCGLL